MITVQDTVSLESYRKAKISRRITTLGILAVVVAIHNINPLNERGYLSPLPFLATVEQTFSTKKWQEEGEERERGLF